MFFQTVYLVCDVFPSFVLPVKERFLEPRKWSLSWALRLKLSMHAVILLNFSELKIVQLIFNGYSQLYNVLVRDISQKNSVNHDANVMKMVFGFYENNDGWQMHGNSCSFTEPTDPWGKQESRSNFFSCSFQEIYLDPPPLFSANLSLWRNTN